MRSLSQGADQWPRVGYGGTAQLLDFRLQLLLLLYGNIRFFGSMGFPIQCFITSLYRDNVIGRQTLHPVPKVWDYKLQVSGRRDPPEGPLGWTPQRDPSEGPLRRTPQRDPSEPYPITHKVTIFDIV